MDKVFVENEALTKIVQMLSDDDEFSEISSKVIKLAGECVECDHSAIVQVSDDSDGISLIAEWGYISCNVPSSLKRNASIFDDDIVVVNDTYTYDEHQNAMELLNAKRIVVSPLSINGEIAMYLMFVNTEDKEFLTSDITFMCNVASVLQAVVQKKVINNSLLSSYTALQDVLNNVGCGVYVYDSNTGEIQFENKIARENAGLLSLVDECAKDYFVKKSQYSSEDLAVMEKYDKENSLWYEIKFCELNWIDSRPVTMCTVFDITQKKKNLEKIQFQAQNDFLTGLYNRMKCESDLKVLIDETVREGRKAAVLFLDLDDFKHINDGLGHQYGDVLLQEIALGLRNIPGLCGHCYRMGGDEFVILLVPDVYDRLGEILEAITVMFNKPWYIMDTEYYCTMSMGIVEFPSQGDTVHELIKKADIAMYKAKKNGKNRYSFYEEASENTSARRLDVEHNMRQAVEAECEEFVVFYQPIIDRNTSKCVACEALVRWNSKAFGLVGPDEFIPLAEYLGLITYIGDYVLEKACIQCKEWNELYDPSFKVSINLSVVQLLQNNVVENIEEIITRTGVNPENIILEITETLAINDMERIIKIIDGIKKMGVMIALDDFGTGYSSLNYIKELKLDIIKVDKSFIEDITEEDYELAFIKLIAELSKTIGVKVCIEGVERANQVRMLQGVDVQLYQGFYYSVPIPPSDFENRYLSV